MRATVRDMRRAPARVAASVAAIALAIAAIGVFAVPVVAEESLREIAAGDRVAHVRLTTSPFADVGALRDVEGVESIEGRTSGTVVLRSGRQVAVVSGGTSSQIDRTRLVAGRMPTSPDEVVVSPGVASVGATIEVAGSPPLLVVGSGTSAGSATHDVVIAAPATARSLTGVDGWNEVVARLDDPSSARLDAAVDEIRSRLERQGVAVTTLPTTAPDGRHPIEDDLTQVSFMIGSLGVVAGLVALTLLASTANVVVTERTRDAAILRAMGGTQRAVRRELRRFAVLVGVVGTVVGIPLGIVVANVIARMVLEDFAGITPDPGVASPIVVASALFGIVGARVVSGRVARRVCRAPLASALRDKEATPFGTRWSDRVVADAPTGGLLSRIAIRSVARRRTRGLAVAAQVAGAVGAAVLVASLAASVTDFDAAELASYRWDTATTPADPIHPYPLGGPAQPGVEVGLLADGTVGDREVELIGVDPATEMVDRGVVAGTWLPAAAAASGPSSSTPHTPAVLAAKYAEQEGIAVGDDLTVDTAAGPVTFRVVGLHPILSVALFVAADDLAAGLGTSGAGNVVWARGSAAPPPLDGVVTRTTTPAGLVAEGVAARDAIVGIFGAIGAIVVVIAVLGATSTVAMNLYERRAELATLRATGARRRDVRTLVGVELGGLAALGWGVGVVAGVAGARAIMGSFEASAAVELGFTPAWSAVPATAVATAALAAVLAGGAARRAQRRPITVTLRAAA